MCKRQLDKLILYTYINVTCAHFTLNFTLNSMLWVERVRNTEGCAWRWTEVLHTYICTRPRGAAWGGWGRLWPRGSPTSAPGCQRGREGWVRAGPAGTEKWGLCTESLRAPYCPENSEWRTSDPGGSAHSLHRRKTIQYTRQVKKGIWKGSKCIFWGCIC